MVDRRDPRIAKATDQRAQAMYRLRTHQRLSFRAIGERFGIGPERVRQIIQLYCLAEELPYPGRLEP